MYLHAHAHTHTHACTHTQTHVQTHTHAHMQTHEYTCALMCTLIHLPRESLEVAIFANISRIAIFLISTVIIEFKSCWDTRGHFHREPLYCNIDAIRVSPGIITWIRVAVPGHFAREPLYCNTDAIRVSREVGGWGRVPFPRI